MLQDTENTESTPPDFNTFKISERVLVVWKELDASLEMMSWMSCENETIENVLFRTNDVSMVVDENSTK